MNSKRMNELEELGRVDAEKGYTKKGKKNLKAEKKRVVRELKDGGSLKPVPAGKKGLAKLPTQVRNKMGFMKDGGKVKDKTKPKKPLSGSMKKPKPGSQSYQFLQTTKPRPSQIETKKAKGGRVGLKSGGIAIRGRGCEIK